MLNSRLKKTFSQEELRPTRIVAQVYHRVQAKLFKNQQSESIYESEYLSEEF